jgi:hypothetical protein
MQGEKLKRAQANWVVDDRFWDREHELRAFIEYLDEGAHVLLVAPRRIGKTSLMREASRLIDGRYLCLHVDLERAHSPSDAIVELSIATLPHAPLWAKTKSVFSNVFDQVAGRIESVKVDDVSVALRSGLNSGNWQSKGDRLFELLAAYEQPVVIFFDEVPILVNRILKGNDYTITPERRSETDAFMSWLRANSIRHKGRIRIVVTGSIGIEPVLAQAGLSATLNSFTPFDLGPWTPDVAAGCIRALANECSIVIDQSVAEHMVESIGFCIPHHVEVFFERVYQECRRRGIRHVSAELTDEVYNTGMLGVRGHVELSHMEERLKMVLGPDLHPLALELLTETALTGILTTEAVSTISRDYKFEGRTQSEVLREILGIAEHDGYLLKDDNGAYVFQSKLLKDWWAGHFGFGFQRASERKGQP